MKFLSGTILLVSIFFVLHVQGADDTCLCSNKASEDTYDRKSECVLSVPCNVRMNSSIWRYQELPDRDDVDDYAVNDTGCKYNSDNGDDDLSQHYLGNVSVGSPPSFTRQLYLRTRDSAALLIKTKQVSYWFDIGTENNKYSSMEQIEPEDKLFARKYTPGFLSPDFYVRVYVKLVNGTLSFGRDCETDPLVSHDIGDAIPNDEEVQLYFRSQSDYGGKILYDCPEDNDDNSSM